MISFLSSWAKGLGVTIVIVSIFEMLLPNNKTKKYIRMILGIYVIFSIISPLIQNKEKFNFNEINLEQYEAKETIAVVDQTSMDERIKQLSEQELEKDILKKLEENGYKVTKCKVITNANKDNEMEIKKIKLTVERQEKQTQKEETTENNTVENKIVNEIEKVKKVETKVTLNNNNKKEEEQQTEEKNTKVSKNDIQTIKKFLSEEYEVKEKCLEIN